MMRPSRGRRRRGAAALELATVLPIFLAIILCEFEASRIGMVTQLLTNAAREGCRTAVINGKVQDDVDARIAQVLQGSGITVGSVQGVSADPGTVGAYIIPANWTSASTNTPVSVVLRVQYASLSWNPNTNGQNNPGAAASILPMPSYASIKLNGQATMNSERP
jgi:Flp pilus assembly protein TadG